MKTYLITGPIGGGKSEVCRYLVSRGFPVYDCDSRTKMLYSIVPGLKSRIEAATGMPWSQIGTIFQDNCRREKVEAIVFPYVRENILEWKAAQTSEAVFIESAIAMDKPLFDDVYDEVILVTASYEVRLARNPKVAQRNALQSFDRRKAEYMIENDSSIEELYRKTDKILCRLI